MARHLKLSTVLILVLVIGALAPIEVTEAAHPFSLRKLKDFLKSVMDMASSQHHHETGEHPHHHRYRVMPTMAPTAEERLSQLSREELEELLEAQLQEVYSKNDTNDTFSGDYPASNYTEDDYDAENSTAGYNDTEGYNTTVGYNASIATAPPSGETSMPPEDNGDEGSKSISPTMESKSAPFRAHEEAKSVSPTMKSKSPPSRVREEGLFGGMGRDRPCNHYFDFSRKWRKLYKYGQKVFGTMEKPTTEYDEEGEETEPASTEPMELEPGAMEPGELELSTTEPREMEPATMEPATFEIEPATMEPGTFEPSVPSKLQQERKTTYMYAQRNRPVYNMVEVQTPRTGTTVLYIQLNRNGTSGIHVCGTLAT